MKVTVETTPESDAKFHVELDWPSIDKAAEKAYKRVAQTQKIPGFRPGHAPRAMIERMVGPNALYEEAIDDLVEDVVRASAIEHELTLLASPHAHVHDIHVGATHEVDLTIPYLGKGELADYHDIQVAEEPVTVTDEDVDQVIERARENMPQWVPAERPAQMGDRVTVDLKLTVGEKQINDLKDHEFDLTEERSGLYTGMDQEIVGMSEGDTKEFTLTLPEDYPKAEMAGQPANYVITLTNVAIKELLPIDEEFAKKVGAYTSVAGMRQAVHDDLVKQRETAARRDVRNKLVEALIERLTLTIPEVLIDAEVEDLMHDLSDMLGQGNMDMNQFLRATGQDPDKYRKTMRPEAIRRIQQRRALELLAERENITATTSDVQSVLENFNRDTPAARRLRMSQLKPSQRLAIERSLVRDRAQDWMMDHLTVDASSATIDDTSSSTDATATDDAPTSEDETQEKTSDTPTVATEAPNA